MNNFHKELLSLLKEFDAIAKKNDIKYSLFAGTLIGAIRHKGFIPWDDDADIILERNQYEKFVSILPPTFIVSRNLWVPRFSNKHNSKIYLDIFVFDATSNVVIFQKLQILGLKTIQGTLKNRIARNKSTFGTFFSFVTYLIGLPFNQGFKLKLYDKLAMIFKYKKSQFIFSSLDQFKYIVHVLPHNILDSYTTVDFEDTELMIMEGYDLYLKQFYGDYMKLPPIKDQKPAHGNFYL